MSRTAPILAAALTLSAGAAAAHTGHGHADLSVVEALRHALGAPDHLLLLAFGFGLTALVAPRVLRLLHRLSQARRVPRDAAPDPIR
jgi:hydrogenase/urease accessory protein HupE